MAKPATVHVEPDIIMAGQQNECVGQSVDNKLNKKERRGEKASEVIGRSASEGCAIYCPTA